MCVMKAFGYDQLPGGKGSARSFYNPNREPDVVTVHEPHGGDTLRQGTLTEYIRKLDTDRDTFLSKLRDC